ncbi:MAG: hypothetical protein RIS47_2003 [Bacteroidota bacterium]
MAQRESSVWYFGNRAGIDFNRGYAVPLADGAMQTEEGCSSIASRDGDLLFYTNGVNVWNRKHLLMENGTGLKGNSSATQSALIVKLPSSDRFYYVFCVDSVNVLFGHLTYSVVDLSLRSGLGEVVVKNQDLVFRAGEKLAATYHANGTDVWIVTEKLSSNEFYAYLLTKDGLVKEPVVSAVGPVLEQTGATNGQLKASPDGRFLASSMELANGLLLMDFDNETGEVSGERFLKYGDVRMPDGKRACCPYGLEFSPNSEFVYVSGFRFVYQYPTSARTVAELEAQQKKIVYSAQLLNSMQLAPDGRIYIARFNSHTLSVIQKPNLVGDACSYAEDAFDLGPGVSIEGLPSFVSNLLADKGFDYQGYCPTEPLSLQPQQASASVLWTGVDAAGTHAFSTDEMNPVLQLSHAGVWVIRLQQFDNAGLLTNDFTQRLSLEESFEFTIGADTVLCDNTEILLKGPDIVGTYLWSGGSTQPELLVTKPGVYSLRASPKDACPGSNQIIINRKQLPSFVLPEDGTICYQHRIEPIVDRPADRYWWNDGITSAGRAVEVSGLFTLSGENVCGVVTDEIQLEIEHCELVIVPNAVLVHADSKLFTIAGIGGASWSFYVFGRWGDKVFESRHYENDWIYDELEPGVYYYILESNDSEVLYKGFFHVF